MAEETKWYQIDVEDVFKTLDADQKGLPNEEAKKRLEKYGRNEVEQKKDTGWVKILVNQFINPLVAVLVVAAFIAVFADKTIDAIVIGVVILVNALIGFF